MTAVPAERTMMQSDEFIEEVRERGGMVSIEDADAAVVAVLSVLARRDLCGEETKFAAQLPAGVGDLFSRDGAPGQHFSAGSFLDRIQQRLGGTDQEANMAARAVLSTAADSVTDGRRAAFINRLPSDFTFFCQLDMP